MFRLSWSPIPGSDGGESDGGNATDDGSFRRIATPDDASLASTVDSSEFDVEAGEAGRRQRHIRYRPRETTISDSDSDCDGDGDGDGDGDWTMAHQSTDESSSRSRKSPLRHPYAIVKGRSGSTKATAETSLASLTEDESEWSSNSAGNSDAEMSSRRPSGDEGDVDTEEEDYATRPTALHRSQFRRGQETGPAMIRPAPIRLSGRASSEPSYASSPIATTITVVSKLRHRHQSPGKSPAEKKGVEAIDVEDPYLQDATVAAPDGPPLSRLAPSSPHRTAWRRKLSKADYDRDADLLYWDRCAYDGLAAGQRHVDDVEEGGGALLPHFPTLDSHRGGPQARSAAAHRSPRKRRGSACECLSCSAEPGATAGRYSHEPRRRFGWFPYARFFLLLRVVLGIGAVTGILAAVRAHVQIASSLSDLSPFGFAPETLVGGAAMGAAAAAGRLTRADIPNPVSAVNAELTRMALKGERGALLERVSHPERIVPHYPSGQWSSPSAQSMAGGGAARAGTYSVRLVASSGRPDLTKSAIEALASCRSVADVRMSTSVDGVLGGWGDVGAVVKRPAVTTDAVLLLSDYVAFTCDELDRAFAIWTKNPDRMVGFFAYDLLSDASRQRWSLEEVPRGQGIYSLLSDRAAFIHRAYLTSLAAKAATDAAALLAGQQKEKEVDYDVSPCKSFALSVAVTSVTSKPPVVVAADPVELRISSSLQKATTIADAGDETNADLAAECLLGLNAAVGVRELPGEERAYVGVERVDLRQ